MMKLGLGLGLGLGVGTPLVSPILNWDNVTNYTDFTKEDAYTYSSGVDISTVANVIGTHTLTGANNAQYDSTLFSGRGGARNTTNLSVMTYSANFTPTNTQTFGGVVWLPTWIADGWLMNFGFRSDAALFHDLAGLIRWYRNEATGLEDVYNDADLLPVLIIGRQNGDSLVDFFVNSLTASSSFDPKNTLGTQNEVRLGARTAADGAVNAGWGEWFQTSDVKTNEEIADTMRYWDTRFGTGFFSSIGARPSIGLLGDSLINTYATGDNNTALRTVLDTGIANTHTHDMALGGSPLFSTDGSSGFVNSTTLEVTTAYNNYVAANIHPQNIKIVVISLGTNGTAANVADPDLFIDCFQVLINQLKIDFPNMTKIIQYVMGRQLGATGQDWQIMRDLDKSVAALDPIIDPDGMEIYYLDYNAGDVHPNAAGELVFTGDMGRRLVAELGQRSIVGTKGMEVIAVEKLTSTTVKLTVAHDGGSGLNVPANGEGYYMVVEGGIENPVLSVAVTSNTELTITTTNSIVGEFEFSSWYAEAQPTAAANTPYTQDDDGLWLRSASFSGIT